MPKKITVRLPNAIADYFIEYAKLGDLTPGEYIQNYLINEFYQSIPQQQ